MRSTTCDVLNAASKGGPTRARAPRVLTLATACAVESPSVPTHDAPGMPMVCQATGTLPMGVRT